MKEAKTTELPRAPTRLLELDILRAAAILLIVLYHLPFDLGIYSVFSGIGTGFFWPFGLTLFFFLSGFAIDFNNKGITSQADIKAFFRKRAQRIYPLYWVSVALSLVLFLMIAPILRTAVQSGVGIDALSIIQPGVGGSDFLSAVIINFLGAQVLLYPRFVSVEGNWFIGTILIFYLLYPIIVHLGKNDVRRIILVSFAVFFGMVVVRAVFHIVGDDRLYLYFGIFVAGIIASRTDLFRSGAIDKRIATSSAFIFFCMLLVETLPAFPTDIVNSYHLDIILYNVQAVLFIVAACYVVRNHAHALSKKGEALVYFIATGSYAVFLFHEPLIVILRLALEKVPQISIIEITLIVVCIGLPALFIVAFYEQRNEREIVKKLLSIIEHQWQRWRSFLFRS
jgi:peptidoglycan/LPS O-acetylase OafA/YrhL